MQKCKSICAEDIKGVFKKRPSRINKGDCGRILCVCGSYDESGLSMCGAAHFVASAAYRTGAGIVEIFTTRENYAPLAAKIPEAVFSLYGKDESEAEVSARLIGAIERADAVVIGCGLGKSQLAKALVITTLKNINVPIVIDADAINIISEDFSLWSLLSEEQGKRTVITPHPGEMSRLCAVPIPEILDDTVGTAYVVAGHLGINCLLKDDKTVISDGDRVYINQSGNPGMASAGMGDVLAGIIGGCLAQRRLTQISDTAYLTAVAAYIHGVCGDLAAKAIGEYSLMASDIIQQIPAVLASDII